MALSFAASTGTSTNDFLTVVSHGAILQSREVFLGWSFEKRETLQEDRGQTRAIDNRGGAGAVSCLSNNSNGGACT